MKWKVILLLPLYLIFGIKSRAQIKAVTEQGDEVVLYKDGSWKYLNTKTVVDESEISINNHEFSKEAIATFLVKSTTTNAGVWINPKGWNFTKGKEPKEFEFSKKNGDLYGMLITEKLEIPILVLREAAINNAKNVSPDIEVIEEEFRVVNGQKVLKMQLNGTIQGMKITYFGYYFSSPKGSIQLVVYTGQSLANEYLADIDILLNGFVVLD